MLKLIQLKLAQSLLTQLSLKTKEPTTKEVKVSKDSFVGKQTEDNQTEKEFKLKQEQQILDHIKKNGRSLSAVLLELMNKPFENKLKQQFILIGETHLENESTPSVFIDSMPSLKKRAKEKNENLVIAVELGGPSLRESARSVKDFSKTNDEIYKEIADGMIRIELKKHNIKDERLASKLLIEALPDLKAMSNLRVYIAARKNNIQTILPDEREYLSQGPTTTSHDEKIMMGNITRDLPSNSRVIYYGGTSHASESNIKKTDDTPIVKTLGTWLSEKYGNKSVISIRTVNYKRGFDSMGTETSSAPPIKNFMSKYGFKTPVIVPATGPLNFNGDKNPYGYSHDYLFIDPGEKK